MHRGYKNIFKSFATLSIIAAVIFLTPTHAFLGNIYISMSPTSTNNTTGYQIYVDDWADLLSEEEESLLLENMKKISEYGNVAFVSIDSNPAYSTDSYAQDYYYDHFGHDSGTVFLIDMDERMIWLESGGRIENTVTRSYALTITDNTYRYASKGDYYSCANVAFEQILTLLEGSSITQPMKYISNALLALAIALLLNYFLAMFLSRAKKASDRQILSGIYTNVNVHNTRADFLHQTKRYSPQSSGSGKGGGHGGGHGGGGHGGGGRSSGGGHRF